MSLSQQRAQHALAQIKQLQSTNNFGNYVSFVKALPANILRNGLGQAMAMERMGATRSGDTGRGHQLLCEHMEEWLFQRRGERIFQSAWQANPRPSHLIDAIVHSSTTEEEYTRAQAEALAYLEWLKKFAVAFLSLPTPTNGGARAQNAGGEA